jgi:hypothetical protein
MSRSIKLRDLFTENNQKKDQNQFQHQTEK